MEGTRHEKAAIVIASYVIGFVTAFILYGDFNINQISDINTIGASNPAALITAPLAPTTSEPVQKSESVTYAEGELIVIHNGQEKLLSFNPEVSSINAGLTALEQGYHYGDLTFKQSADSSYVFFCEQHEETIGTCSGYVYDIAADTIYPVIKDGKAAVISLASAKDTIWTSLGLKIGQNYSANSNAPWVMIDDQSELDVR